MSVIKFTTSNTDKTPQQVLEAHLETYNKG
jgi:hypothetical protein